MDVNPLKSGNPLTGNFGRSGVSLGPQLIAMTNRPSEQDIQYYLKIITLDSSMYIFLDHPDRTLSNFMATPLVYKESKE